MHNSPYAFLIPDEQLLPVLNMAAEQGHYPTDKEFGSPIHHKHISTISTPGPDHNPLASARLSTSILGNRVLSRTTFST
jgi:hypothetical protein